MAEEGEFAFATQSEDESVIPTTNVFVLTPPGSPKLSGVLDPESSSKKRRKPERKHPASKVVQLPRCHKCGVPIDLNELFRLHEELKQPVVPKVSRPANEKTRRNFQLWRDSVREITGAKAPVNSTLKPDVYAKVKELYESKAKKSEETKASEVTAV